MKSSSEVVIIGAGIIGMSVALHLARMGCRDVLVLDRLHSGSGSSGKGVGGFRQQFDTLINVRLSQLSLPMLLELGAAIELQQAGYLYLALSEYAFAHLRERVVRQQAWGVPTELLAPAAVTSRFPYLNTSDVYGAAFCAHDGYARPSLALEAYTREAVARGVQLVEDTALTGFELVATPEGQRIEALRTSRGRIATQHVVLAAGAWSAQVAALAGVMLPVTPLKRQTFTSPAWSGAVGAPMTIDQDTGFHFRPEGQGLRLAMAGNEQPGVEELSVDEQLGQQMAARALHRLPGLAALYGGNRPWAAGGRAGLYELTPDAHPVLGAVPGVSGLICCCGFSGHGFMHSPAAGLLTAELITTGAARSLDIAPLAITRFAEGRLLGEAKTL